MTPRRYVRPLLLKLSLAALLPLIALTATPADRSEAAGLVLTPFISGLNTPVGIVHAGDNSQRIFVVEQGGTIKVFEADGDPLGTFLNVSSLVSTGFEAGLLGLAFPPNYESSGRFYIFYTNTGGDLTIARYTVSGNPNVANPTGEPFLTIPHPNENNHNGGQLNFGPDSFLYAAIGDGGGANDPNGNGQNNNQLLGKILRLDVSGATGYTSPTTNPFCCGSVPGRDEIWATGLRNPWRFTFDRTTGDLFIADVGQGNREEVNFQTTDTTVLRNYGWKIMEGDACFSPPSGCDTTGLTMPILTYGHGSGDCSITGGYRYRGTGQPTLAAKYFYADYCTGRIWGATLSGSSWSATEMLDTDYNISTFGEDEAGELYVADASGGVVYRMVEDATDTDGDTVPDTTDNCPTVSNTNQANADRDVRPNGPMISNDDITYIKHDFPGDACDSDDDNDGRSDTAESGTCGTLGVKVTNPLLVDTDGDRLTDGWECSATPTSDPTLASSKTPGTGTADADGDRITDLWEQRGYNASGSSTDSDGDGCHDMVELASVDGNRVVGDPDRLAVARRALGVWGAHPEHDVLLDMDKGGAVGDSDRLFVARAALLPSWVPKSCP